MLWLFLISKSDLGDRLKIFRRFLCAEDEFKDPLCRFLRVRNEIYSIIILETVNHCFFLKLTEYIIAT